MTIDDPTPLPLTTDRVAGVLSGAGFDVTADEQGDLTLLVAGNIFFVYVIGGHTLQVLGTWGRALPASEFDDVLRGANAVHLERLYPRIGVGVTEQGILAISARHPADFTFGVSDAHLAHHLTTGLEAILAYFSELDERYPQAPSLLVAQG